MSEQIKRCGQCPNFEWFLDEFEDGVGMVGKGRCLLLNEDEVWETRYACKYAINYKEEI